MIGFRATGSSLPGHTVAPTQILAPKNESNLRRRQGQGT
jgi:hypothetical protein